MKIFRKLITFAAALIILLFVIGFILPKSIEIEQTISIESPIDSVFKNVSHFDKFAQWTPWRKYDPNMVISYEGTMGEEGSKYLWKGNEDVGKGVMEITGIENNKRVDINLSFIEPWESNSQVYFTFKGTGNDTFVTWGYSEKTPVPKNVMSLIFGVKKMLSSEFEKGLANLKTYCE